MEKLAKETRESQKKEKIDQKLRIKPYLDLYDESIRHLTESMMLVAGTIKKMAFDKNRENEFERALTKTDSTIVDERYRFLEDLPKERLKVWLDAYELYKRDKKARKTVTLTIAPSKLHNNISSQSKPLVEVHWEELEWRGEFTDGKIYLIGTDTPFTGISHRFHPNGMKSCQTSWKDGKRHGLDQDDLYHIYIQLSAHTHTDLDALGFFQRGGFGRPWETGEFTSDKDWYNPLAVAWKSFYLSTHCWLGFLGIECIENLLEKS